MPRDPEKARIRRKRWKLAHPEKHKAAKKRYRDAHREALLQKARQYPSQRNRRPNNPETSRKREAKRRMENLEQVRADDRNAQAKWRRENPEKNRSREEAYRKAHPGRNSKYSATRRARIAQIPIIHTTIDIKVLHKRDKGLCSLCGTHVHLKLKFPDRKSATVDHIVPISLPGTQHSYTNAKLAHLGCNASKQNRVDTYQMYLL